MSPAVQITIAVLSMLGLVVGPALVAVINRGGKAAAVDLPPDKVMPRREYDALLEQLARLDDENDRLARENSRLRDEALARALENARKKDL